MGFFPSPIKRDFWPWNYMEAFKTLELWYSAAWFFFVSRLSLRIWRTAALILFHRNRGIVHIQGFFFYFEIYFPSRISRDFNSFCWFFNLRFHRSDSNNGFSRRRKEKMNDEAAANRGNLHDQTTKGVTWQMIQAWKSMGRTVYLPTWIVDLYGKYW